MSEFYEERVMEMMSNQNPNYPYDQSGRPPSWTLPDQGPITVTKEMDARARFPIPETNPSFVAVRYSDGRSVWERDSREDVKALLERVAELEARLQALEAKQ
jgi:hypothetical protein